MLIIRTLENYPDSSDFLQVFGDFLGDFPNFGALILGDLEALCDFLGAFRGVAWYFFGFDFLEGRGDRKSTTCCQN